MKEMPDRSIPSIRQAVVDDIPQLVIVNLKSWNAAYRDLLPASELAEMTHEAVTATWLKNLTKPVPRSDTLIVSQSDTLLAYSRFYPSVDVDDDPTRVATIGSMYVLPELWRRRIGTQLMSAVLSAIHDCGFSEATLHVLANNRRARAFYERDGWALDTQPLLAEIMEGSAPKFRYRKVLTESDKRTPSTHE